MKRLKILLVGQPNVGKSSLLNILVGPKVTVSNYPGTTVELTQARKRFNDTEIEFVDTPGIYSISDRSEEEKVTEHSLFEIENDGAVLVADATSLERSLYMALQISEANIPIVIALNFVEEAEKKGIKIDCEKMEMILNLPVTPINPLTGKGIETLVGVILKIKEQSPETFSIQYDDHVEQAVNTVSQNVVDAPSPKRLVALRVLEGDKDFYHYLKDKKIIEKVEERLKDHPRIGEDIAITRYGTASYIAGKVTQITSLKRKKELEEDIDRVLLHRTWGPLTTFASLLTVFGVLLYLGNQIQQILMGLTESLPFLLSIIGYSVASMVLTKGLTGAVAGVSIALPYVFLFYLFLGVLEDVGILSRFVVNMERFLRKIELPGKAFIPLALGFGCTVPAITTTRVLSSKDKQFHSASFFAFIPCSSRNAIIMGVVGFYGGVIPVLQVFVTSIIAGIIWALVYQKVAHAESELLLLELPPYRKPLIRNVLVKSWIRMKDFVYIVIPLLMLGGIAYGILDAMGLTEAIVQPFAMITDWLGLPSSTLIPLLFGFLQKDLTGAMLISVLGTKIDLALTPIQIYTFGVTATLGIPCIIAFGMLAKEFGLRKAAFLTATSILYGILVAGLGYKITSFLSTLP
jgi:ferrous iron transport protein B